jgi:hypothetical protein
VDADDHQTVLLVLLRPFVNVRNAVLAIDAVERSEVDEHHLPA